MSTENCPRCGNNNLVNDIIDDEMVYWCPACGYDVTNEILSDEMEEAKLEELMGRAERLEDR